MQNLYYHPWIESKLLVRCIHPRDRIYAIKSQMDSNKPKIVPDSGASDKALFLDLVDKHVEWGPQRVGHIGFVATLLELAPWDRPLDA